MKKANRLQRNATKNFLAAPSSSFVTAYIAVWFVSTLLLFAAMTDLFTQTPFQGKYLMIWFLLIASSFAVVRVLIAYRRRKKQMAN